MNSFRELVERVHVAHTDFTKAWKTAPHGHASKEPQDVTETRVKFRQALNALFVKLEPLEQAFLAGDPQAIDAILDFSEVDIPAFRCGYAKQKYFRKLKSLSLNKAQEERLRRLAYDLCRSPNYGREITDLARLMIRLANDPLIRELQQLSRDTDDRVRKKSQRMLDVILHNRVDLRTVAADLMPA